jgi:hypothetical protein
MKKNLLLLCSFLLMVPSWAQLITAPEPAATKLKRSFEITREQEPEEMNLTVYPNPTSGIVNLSLSGFSGKKTSLSIVNVIGTVIYHETLQHVDGRYNKTIDLSKSAHGLYYVKLEAEDYNEIRKIILK